MTDRAICTRRRCPEGSVDVGGKCEHLGRDVNARYCQPSLQLIVNEHGEPECECPLTRVWHSPSQACYAPFKQGPCPKGQIFQVGFKLSMIELRQSSLLI